MSEPYDERWKKEIERFLDRDCPVIEKPGMVYIQGPGEAAPKRRYYECGPAVQSLTVALLRCLGIRQHTFFQHLMLDLRDKLNEELCKAGKPLMKIPWEEIIKADNVLWAKHDFRGKRQPGTRIVVHENDGVPLSIKTEQFIKHRDAKAKKAESDK